MKFNPTTGKLEVSGGGGTPGGSSGQIQFNNSGSFGADSKLSWDNTNKSLLLGDGTSANPSLAIASAPNNGLKYGGSNSLVFVVGGATGLYVNSSGFRFPTGRTFADSSSGNNLLKFTNTDATGNDANANFFEVKNGAATVSPVLGVTGTDSNIDLTFTPKGAGNAIFSTGNVGIGTSSPTAQLSFSEQLGSELVTNPSFTGSATGWTLGTGWTYSSNSVSFSGTGFGYLTPNTPASITAGQYYKFVVIITACSGEFIIQSGAVTIKTITAPGTYSFYDLGASSTQPTIFKNSAGSGSITVDDFSIKYVASSQNAVSGNEVITSPVFALNNPVVFQGISGIGSYPSIDFSKKMSFFFYPNKDSILIGKPDNDQWQDANIGTGNIVLGGSDSPGINNVTIGGGNLNYDVLGVQLGLNNTIATGGFGNLEVGVNHYIDASGGSSQNTLIGSNNQTGPEAFSSLQLGSQHIDYGTSNTLIGYGHSTVTNTNGASILGTTNVDLGASSAVLIGTSLIANAGITTPAAVGTYLTMDATETISIGFGDGDNATNAVNSVLGSIQFFSKSTNPTLFITESDQTGIPVTGTGRVLIATTTDNGTDKLQVNGTIRPTGYKSSDGSAGITATIATAKLTLTGTNGSMTFKNGILTAQTPAT